MAAAARLLQSIYRMAVPLSIGAVAVNASLYDVKGGSRAVIFDRLSGVKEDVINEGTHFLVPWLQRAIVFDVRTKPRNIATTTGSKDLQMVSLTLRVLHRPNVTALPKIYQVRSLINSPENRSIVANPTIRTSVPTTTNVFFPPSVTKSLRPSSPSSTPPSSSPSVRPFPSASVPTSPAAPQSSTSLSRTSPSPT